MSGGSGQTAPDRPATAPFHQNPNFISPNSTNSAELHNHNPKSHFSSISSIKTHSNTSQMDRLREIAGLSKKRRLIKDGAPIPSRSSSSPPPQPPQESGQGSSSGNPTPTPTIIPYPFGKKFRLTTEMKEKEKNFKDFEILTPIFPDIDTLRLLMILDDIRNYFEVSGLDFVFKEDPGTYESLVREFSYSFKPKWITFKRSRTKSGVEERRVEEWSFRLGGRDFVFNSEELRAFYGFPQDVDIYDYPHVHRDVKNDFWRMITKSNEDFKPSQMATKIKVPVWKFVHRFIATCIFLRKDGGRWVNSDDLVLMCCMNLRMTIDPLFLITRALDECQHRLFRGKYLGGGHFITIIAQACGFSLDPDYQLPKKTLGLEEMVARKFVKRIKSSRGDTYNVIGRDQMPGEPTPPSSPQLDQGGPSSVPSQPSQYDEVLRRLDNLTTYNYELASWHGQMMSGLYTNLGFDGYVPPPRPNFWNEEQQSPIVHSHTVNDAMEEDDAEDDDAEDETPVGDEDSSSTGSGDEDAYVISHRN